MDAVGTNIRLDARGREVMRALPRINEDVNEEWAQRQDPPRGRRPASATGSTGRGCAKAASCARRAGTRLSRRSPRWRSRPATASRRSPATCVDVETMYRGQGAAGALGSDLIEGRQTGLDYDTSNLAAVNFNTTIAGIETADAILLVGSQSALGGAAGQHPHPQGGEDGREGLRDRAGGRSHLSGRMARRRSVAARQACPRRSAEALAERRSVRR